MAVARVPISAEARGKRRILFRQLGEQMERLRQRFHSARANELARAWLFKGGKGRIRAQRQLVELFGPAARLRLVTDTYLGFLYLRPSHGAIINSDPDDPGLTQDCIAAMVLLVGQLPGHTRHQGLILSSQWSLEFSEHAVGRLIERSPKADPIEVMVAAHDALMRADIPRLAEFWVPGQDAGAFACHTLPGTVDDKVVLYCRARTWLDSDQLTVEPIVPEGAPEKSVGPLLLPSVLVPQEISDELRRLWGSPDGA